MQSWKGAQDLGLSHAIVETLNASFADPEPRLHVRKQAASWVPVPEGHLLPQLSGNKTEIVSWAILKLPCTKWVTWAGSAFGSGSPLLNLLSEVRFNSLCWLRYFYLGGFLWLSGRNIETSTANISPHSQKKKKKNTHKSYQCVTFKTMMFNFYNCKMITVNPGVESIAMCCEYHVIKHHHHSLEQFICSNVGTVSNNFVMF